MSIFRVSEEHVNALVTLARALAVEGEGFEPLTDPSGTGQRLWELNFQSVSCAEALRNPHTRPRTCPKYTFRRSWFLRKEEGIDPADIPLAAKLIHCYQAQTGSAPGWFGSGPAGQVRAWMDYLIDKLIRQLPGYEEAPWGI